jgi:hypothetical protein
VRFVHDQANIVYGNDFNFNFTPPKDGETIFDALQAVTDVLNAEDPIPPGASAQGSGQFFIGYMLISDSIVAVGGENTPGGGWGQCETDCTNGVALQGPYELVTWADFDRVVTPNVVQVFRTSTTHQGDLGQFDPSSEDDGLAGADAECQERAEDAGLAGTWTAWLSTSSKDGVPGVDAIDRILDGRYELVDGTVIADDMADLTDGELNAPINLNEFGSKENDDTWTGTRPDGTDTGTNCSNWTSSGGEGGCTEGAPDCGVYGSGEHTTNSTWTQFNNVGVKCTEDSSLYCFGGGE